MKLSDIISATGETAVAEMTLLLAFVAFVTVTIWAIRRPRQEIDECARIPLEDNGGHDR